MKEDWRRWLLRSRAHTVQHHSFHCQMSQGCRQPPPNASKPSHPGPVCWTAAGPRRAPWSCSAGSASSLIQRFQTSSVRDAATLLASLLTFPYAPYASNVGLFSAASKRCMSPIAHFPACALLRVTLQRQRARCIIFDAGALSTEMRGWPKGLSVHQQKHFARCSTAQRPTTP